MAAGNHESFDVLESTLSENASRHLIADLADWFFIGRL